MSFLNSILLGGIAAFMIPLVIHLLNKRRFRTVHWGAMHLITPLLKKNNRRINLEQILLLLLRVAIPIVLALCLARPVYNGVRKFKGDEKTSTVFVLDDSFSMQDGTAAQSNFAKARAEVAKTIKSMRDGSDASIITMGGRPSPLLAEPTVALEDLSAALRDAPGGSGVARVAESIQNTQSEFAKMTHGAREVVFVSDFQERDWVEAAASRRNALDQMFDMPIPPNLTLFRVSGGSGENVSIETVLVSSLVLGAGQKFSVRAELKNHGETSYPDLTVFFKVNGEEKRSSQVTLGAGQSAQALFTHTFDQAGSHFIEVSMDADALEADNRFVAAFPVWDEVPVLLVDGSPSPRPLGGETDYLQIALRPFASARAELSDLVRSEAIRASELDANRIEGKRVVVLANVERLGNHQLEQLEQFVQDGGGLLVFPGDEIDIDWYDRQFFKDGKGLLARQYTDLLAPATRGAEPARISGENLEHPALAFFNDPENGSLGEAEFDSWYRMGLSEELGSKVSPTDDRELITLARFVNRDPYLLERQFGEGRVLQCAAPADADWSTLPGKPVYLPLMQRLVTYLAASVDPPRNLASGQKLVAVLPADLAGGQAVIEDPTGTRHQFEITRSGSRAIAEFDDTSRPGIYTLTTPGQPAGIYHFAVNLDRRESDLLVLDERGVRELADEMDAAYVTSFEDYVALDRQRRYGIEYWKPLLYLLVAFLFLELFYQQWIARRRSA